MISNNTKRGRKRTRKEIPPIRALERGLAVLETLGNAGRATLSDIARATDLSCSTAFRVLETLRQSGCVDQDEATGLYHLGFKVAQLGARFADNSPLPHAAHPTMRLLVDTVDETANLAILDGCDAVYIHQVESQHSIRMFTQLGARAPVYCSGVGKVLLAWRPPQEVEQLLADYDFVSYTSTTITTLPDLMIELRRVRSRGYAVDDQEREMGIRCVTAPVRKADGTVIAALSISGPVTRFGKKLIAQRARHVIRAADEISGRLGYISRDSNANGSLQV